MSQFLIYGANGYTGELITRVAVERGLKPIIAGRNESAIKSLAESTDWNIASSRSTTPPNSTPL